MSSITLYVGNRAYPFWFPNNLQAAPRSPCIYILMRKARDGSWEYLYIGETDDAFRRLNVDSHVGDGHAKAVQMGANFFAVMLAPSDKDQRCQIESDLVKAYDPKCNDRLRLSDELVAALTGIAPRGPRRF